MSICFGLHCGQTVLALGVRQFLRFGIFPGLLTEAERGVMFPCTRLNDEYRETFLNCASWR